MSGLIPERIGPYGIDRELGRGAGGVVYLAVDDSLGRRIAIKALPSDVVADDERLTRLEREARALAAIDHPNVATIHGLESHGETRYLVLEYVAGESLDQTLARGPMPLADALDCVRQVADGLEAAHERGIVHRDLKPANVCRTADGVVKLLDFGLAKPADLTAHNPVLTSRDAIVGTPAYLAPEQVRGASADRRVDVWAFGCLTFELLTGQRMFAGDTLPELFRTIVDDEPRWDLLPARTPPRVRELLQRCAEKDPRDRLRDIGDARVELERTIANREWSGQMPIGGGVATPRSRRVRWSLGVAFGLGALAAAAVFGWAIPTPEASSELTRLSIDVGGDTNEPLELYWSGTQGAFRISPDGRSIAVRLVPRSESGQPTGARVYIRQLADDVLIPVSGSEDVRAFDFSPDSRWLCMVVPESVESTRKALVKVRVDGGAPERLADWPDESVAWLANGEIVGGQENPFGLLRIDPSSGVSREFPVRPKGFEPAYDPLPLQCLPDGRSLLVELQSYETDGFAIHIGIADLETGDLEIIVRDAGSAHWSPTGHLLFTRRDRLHAIAIDVGSGGTTVRGDPVRLIGDLLSENSWGHARFDLASDGTLILAPGGRRGSRRTIAVVSAEGTVEPWSADELAFEERIESSWDQSRFTVTRVGATGLFQVWGSEFDPPRIRLLVSDAKADCHNAIVSATGEFLVHERVGHELQNGLFKRVFDGSGLGELVFARSERVGDLHPIEISPDDRSLLLREFVAGRAALRLVPLDGRESTVVAGHDADVGYAGYSPDGQWIGYVSSASGRTMPFVRRRDPATEALGPEQAVPLPPDRRPWGAAWGKSLRDGRPELWLTFGMRRYEALALLNDEPPLRFAKPRHIASLESVRFVDDELLGDDRIMCILPGVDEQPVARIDVLRGLSGKLRAAFVP